MALTDKEEFRSLVFLVLFVFVVFSSARHLSNTRDKLNLGKSKIQNLKSKIDMSQRDGFTGGFIAGAILGSVVGGVIGAIVAGRTKETEDSDTSLLDTNASEPKPLKAKKRQLKDAEGMEVARRSLEDKIAQLNSAIDEVRLSLGRVNGNVVEKEKERSLEP